MSSRAVAVLVLLVASFMDLLDTTIVNVALPTIEKELSTTAAQLEWIVSGYILAFAVLLITSGRLGDIFGRKRLFLVGVAGFTLASATAALAWNGDSLVAARIIQGAFAAVMSPQVLSIIQVLFSPKERAAVYGAYGGISGLAAVAGPLLGGLLISGNAFGWGWRSIFLINVPIGILLFIGGVIYISESKSADRPRLDIPGVALATAGLFLLVYGLIEGREYGWPGWIWGMIGGSILVFVLFVVYQRRRDARDGSALVPPSLFDNRGYSAGIITQFTLAGSVGSFFLVLILYLQMGLGFSAIDAALTTLPFSLGALVGSGISIPLGHRFGKFLILFGALAQAGGFLWVVTVVAHKADALTGIDLILPMALAGAGLTLVAVPLTDVALAQMPVTNAGAASGVFGTVQQVGSALGVAVIGVVFFGIAGTQFTPGVLRDGFISSMWVPIIALIISAVATFFLPSVAAVRQHKIDAEVVEVS
ncbi:MAG: hypothetical protein B5766_05780 [Candidatus Lumbricidophila eiseniae]|uniref:Major facilitator superfamily (MFS) profile domain-containing protein n=1 Tax=Candidatus Lumbricidiphila eiseniae TaxID=1969409 RepID=A0A2A6FRP9_9MICO|nr:MAG: hypothetical protein B5766_05780 [Candidatus Lumbricidophila eiseniae]